MLSLLVPYITLSLVSTALAQGNTLQWTQLPSTFKVGVAATLSWQGGDLSTPYNVTLISSCSDLSCAAVIGNIVTNTQAQTTRWTPGASLDLKSYYYLALYQGNNQKQTNNFLIQAAAGSGGGSAVVTNSPSPTITALSTILDTATSGPPFQITITISTNAPGSTVITTITSTSSFGSSSSSTSISSNDSNSTSSIIPTAAATSSSSSSNTSPSPLPDSSSSGLSASGKIGLGLGLGLGGALMIAGIAAFVLWRRRRREYGHGYGQNGSMGAMEKDLRKQREPGVGVGMSEPGVAVD